MCRNWVALTQGHFANQTAPAISGFVIYALGAKLGLIVACGRRRKKITT